MFIGVDCGTQGTKAIIWDCGNILSSAYSEHDLMLDDDGKREQNPIWWFNAMMASIQKALAPIAMDKRMIKGIGISGQQHGLVLLDKNDQVICDSLLWCDTRPESVLREFETEHDINFVESLGIQVPVAFTLGKLLWVKKNNPDAFRRINKVMLPHDYLNYRLTGRYAIEPGDASGSGWFDTKRKEMNDKILSLIDLPEIYRKPSVVSSHEIFGKVRPEICRQLGLSLDVIVSAGGGDNMMAAIGTANVSKGNLTVSLGTSGTVFAHSEQQVESERFPDLNAFCSSTGHYLPLTSTMNVTTANNLLLNLLDLDIDDFDNQVCSAPIGSEGLQSLPFYNGARLPNVPSSQGALLGMTATNVSKTNLLRATVEGVTFNLARGVDILREAGLPFSSARVIGGGAKSAVWRQMIADVTNLEVKTPESAEAAALGGAIQAYWAWSNDSKFNGDLSSICREFVHFNDKHTVHPNAAAHRRYHELSLNYQDKVDSYMSSNLKSNR